MPEEPPAPQGCEATPLDGTPHGGPVAAYVRICPAGHVRSGYACAACYGNGAILCAGCGSKRPAILIPAETWRQVVVGYSDGRELTAEGAGPLLDEACRDGDCRVCEGAPCEHDCGHPGQFPMVAPGQIAAEVAADVRRLGAAR